MALNHARLPVPPPRLSVDKKLYKKTEMSREENLFLRVESEDKRDFLGLEDKQGDEPGLRISSKKRGKSKD